MLKDHFHLILFLWMTINSGVVAQTTPELILPEEVNSTVLFKIKSSSDLNDQTSNDKKLAVFVKNETAEYLSNAIQGNYKITEDYISFKPFLPFEAGIDYMVRTVNHKSVDGFSYHPFQIERKGGIDQAKVIRIYPTADQLPDNLLRFYVYFNTPMRKGQALEHIELVDENGRIDKHAFMEFKQELWSADGKRLTLLFDPGRIKRGVSTNELMGPALLAGKRYQLNISSTWQDVYGQNLTLNFRKAFTVHPGYRQHLKLTNWEIVLPKVKTNDPFSIHLDRILDYALMQSMLKIKDEKDNDLAGYWEILDGEQGIRFIPKNQWKKGNYQIIIDSRLEDIAGNNLQNLLDHKQTDKNSNRKSYYSIEFKI